MKGDRTLKFLVLGMVAMALFTGFVMGINVPQSTHASILDDILHSLGAKTTTQVPVSAPYTSSSSYEASVVNAVQAASPSVVSIIVSKNLPVVENCKVNPFSDIPPELRPFFGQFDFRASCTKGMQLQEIGGGSGFIVGSDGLILTNKHVVSDAKAEYTALTNDGKKYTATVVARDPVQDIALVRITAPKGSLTPITLNTSGEIKLGQTAIAIGNALGEFRNTVSVGIVSGLARSITAGEAGGTEDIEGLIQTDAAINPGNSGGPLLNLKGEVIGINTAIAEGAQNIGFAIPIFVAMRDIESVKATGKISVPYLGVRYLEITSDLATQEKLPVTVGVLVRGSTDGPAVIALSPAAKAGIVAGDILTEVNGEKITETTSLSTLIQKYKVGESVHIKGLRAGKSIQFTIVLGERPQ